MTHRTVLRYRSIAAHAQALTDAPGDASPDARSTASTDAAIPARDALHALVLDAALRLRALLAAMPGALDAPPPSLIARLADALDGALTPPPPPSRR